MGRELKRVPLDFDWPMNKKWPGYLFSVCSTVKGDCDLCRKFAEMMNFQTSEKSECPRLPLDLEPPKGEGFQLWETTSEGSPASPVFATLEELCEWCEDNATTFASFKATKEDWKKMLEADFVYHQQGSVVFL